MDIRECELRLKAYQWLTTLIGWVTASEESLFSLVQKKTGGDLPHALQSCSVDELRDATKATYTAHKKQFIKDAEGHLLASWKTYAEYIERLEYELKVVQEMGYNTYFLVVQDYINRARTNTIMVGPGRGSCAGSLMSYVIGITDLDPLSYDLLFERFLNPWRISLPDIDTDFEDTQREQVIDYIKQKYGTDNVANIGTFMTMAAKAAFKDVARVMGVSFEQSNKISALITDKTIAESLKTNDDLKKTVEQDDRIKHVVLTAQKLEWTVRQTGVHACGMIIAPSPVINFSPIQYPPKTGSKERDETRTVAQFDGHSIEDIGLLKMDLLGLRNLTIIKHCIKIIRAKAKKEKTMLPEILATYASTMLFHPPLDDAHTYKRIFQTWDTSGVFQFESDGMKNWLKKLKPTDFNDITVMVALYRPGPMEFIPHYVDRKQGLQEVRYIEQELIQELTQRYGNAIMEEEKTKITHDLQPFMEITYGIAVYQEQLMRLVQTMAGFSLAEADNLRRWVGKKIREVIEKIKGEFIARAQAYKWYKPETAKWIYEKMIEPAADYSFNKSHAACYAYITYQTAYLKAHYPIEFHAALLRSVEEETEKLAKFIDEIQLQWYTIKAPDVNLSFEHVAAVDGAILLGFRAIKGVGADIAQAIEQERTQHGNYTSLTDFLQRNESYLNKKSLEAMIKAWCLDAFGDRFTLLANVGQLLEWTKHLAKQQQQGWLFGEMMAGDASLHLAPAPTHGPLAYLACEQEVFKTLISGHPFDGLYTFLKQKVNFISSIKDTENFGEFKIIGYIKEINRGMKGWYFLTIEDISGTIELYLQDKLDLEPFDIIHLFGYKGMRTPKIDKIIVLDITQLREQAKKWNSYSPENTVALVRKERMEKATTKQAPAAPTPSTPVAQKSPALAPSKSPWESNEFSFTTPEDISILTKIPWLIKMHPGNIVVTIGKLQANLSEKGIALLRELLAQ